VQSFIEIAPLSTDISCHT